MKANGSPVPISETAKEQTRFLLQEKEEMK